MPSKSTGFCVAKTVKFGDEGVPLAVNRDLPLLHALEQCRLGSRRHSVHFVNQQEVGENRSSVQLEGAGRHVQNLGSDDVRGHQVGGTLHPLKIKIQNS